MMYDERDTHYGTVNGKIYQLAFLDYVDHPFASQASRHKGRHESHGKRPHPDIRRSSLDPMGHSLCHIEYGFS